MQHKTKPWKYQAKTFITPLKPKLAVYSESPATVGAADCSPKHGCLKTDNWAGAGGCDLCVHCAYI